MEHLKRNQIRILVLCILLFNFVGCMSLPPAANMNVGEPIQVIKNRGKEIYAQDFDTLNYSSLDKKLENFDPSLLEDMERVNSWSTWRGISGASYAIATLIAIGAFIDEREKSAAVSGSIALGFVFPLWYFSEKVDGARSNAVHKYNELLNNRSSK